MNKGFIFERLVILLTGAGAYMLVEHVDTDSGCNSCNEDEHNILNKIIQYM